MSVSDGDDKLVRKVLGTVAVWLVLAIVGTVLGWAVQIVVEAVWIFFCLYLVAVVR